MNYAAITLFHKLWLFFNNFISSSIIFCFNFSEFNRYIRSVAFHNWTISILDLSRMVQNDNLSLKACHFFCWIIISIRYYIPTLDLINFHILYMKSNKVSSLCFRYIFMVHFYRINFTLDCLWSNYNRHSWFQYTLLYCSYCHSSNSTYLVLSHR